MIKHNLNARFPHPNKETDKLANDIAVNINNRFHYSFPMIDSKNSVISKTTVLVKRWPTFKTVNELKQFVDNLGYGDFFNFGF